MARTRRSRLDLLHRAQQLTQAANREAYRATRPQNPTDATSEESIEWLVSEGIAPAVLRLAAQARAAVQGGDLLKAENLILRAERLAIEPTLYRQGLDRRRAAQRKLDLSHTGNVTKKSTAALRADRYAERTGELRLMFPNASLSSLVERMLREFRRDCPGLVMTPRHTLRILKSRGFE